jgi:hypothetical protein
MAILAAHGNALRRDCGSVTIAEGFLRDPRDRLQLNADRDIFACV